MNTIIYKSYNNVWTSKTKTILKDNLQLSIMTYRTHSKAIITSLSCSCVDDKQDGYTIEKHSVFEDYFKRIRHDSNKRATKSYIEQCHNSVLSNIDQWLNDAKKHYDINCNV